MGNRREKRASEALALGGGLAPSRLVSQNCALERDRRLIGQGLDRSFGRGGEVVLLLSRIYTENTAGLVRQAERAEIR